LISLSSRKRYRGLWYRLVIEVEGKREHSNLDSPDFACRHMGSGNAKRGGRLSRQRCQQTYRRTRADGNVPRREDRRLGGNNRGCRVGGLDRALRSNFYHSIIESVLTSHESTTPAPDAFSPRFLSSPRGRLITRNTSLALSGGNFSQRKQGIK
jgi:hypothetical protein